VGGLDPILAPLRRLPRYAVLPLAHFAYRLPRTRSTTPTPVPSVYWFCVVIRYILRHSTLYVRPTYPAPHCFCCDAAVLFGASVDVPCSPFCLMLLLRRYYLAVRYDVAHAHHSCTHLPCIMCSPWSTWMVDTAAGAAIPPIIPHLYSMGLSTVCSVQYYLVVIVCSAAPLLAHHHRYVLPLNNRQLFFFFTSLTPFTIPASPIRLPHHPAFQSLLRVRCGRCLVATFLILPVVGRGYICSCGWRLLPPTPNTPRCFTHFRFWCALLALLLDYLVWIPLNTRWTHH